ncbi:MAG TPA: hypothetical protein VLD83_08445 [Candidatus Binatia bacterium]|nr:hypothetical protein [Candidatus Binatia bacterium]
MAKAKKVLALSVLKSKKTKAKSAEKNQGSMSDLLFQSAFLFHLRAQHRQEGIAALKAVAHARGVIEGDLVKAQLMNLYQAKLEQTLIGRGLFSLAKSLD